MHNENQFSLIMNEAYEINETKIMKDVIVDRKSKYTVV